MAAEDLPSSQNSQPAEATVRNEAVAPAIGQVLQAGTIQGDVYLRPEPDRVVPRQLPAAPGSFTGRHDERARLNAVLGRSEPGGTVVISAINGTGGIGSPTLELNTIS